MREETLSDTHDQLKCKRCNISKPIEENGELNDQNDLENMVEVVESKPKVEFQPQIG